MWEPEISLAIGDKVADQGNVENAKEHDAREECMRPVACVVALGAFALIELGIDFLGLPLNTAHGDGEETADSDDNEGKPGKMGPEACARCR